MRKQIDITVGEIYSEITSAPRGAWAIIRSTCKARPEGFQFMPKYQAGTWDGYISLMKGFRRFPTGLKHIVWDALEREGYSCEYDKARPRWIPASLGRLQHILHGITLREYQVEAVIDLMAAQRGVAKMATNAGKTAVYAAVIKILGNSDALIVVRSKDLLYQTQERLKGYLQRDVGLIGDSHRDETDIRVATIQTLNSLKKHHKAQFKEFFANNKILVVDEAHMVGHNKTFDILMEIPGWHRYGVSGTPLNRGALPDLKLIACTGPVCVSVSNAQLIEDEWSAKPIIHMHQAYRLGLGAGRWNAGYQDAYDTCIVRNSGRNEQVVHLALIDANKGRSVLIIVTRIAHGQALQRFIDYTTYPCVFVHGNSELSKRQEALRMLDEETCIVIATNIFDEGVDVPALDTIILACGGKSQIRLLQRIGRGLRKKAGENVVHIHDFIDCDNKYLLNHSEERLNVYEKEGFQVEYEKVPKKV